MEIGQNILEEDPASIIKFHVDTTLVDGRLKIKPMRKGPATFKDPQFKNARVVGFSEVEGRSMQRARVYGSR